MRNVITLLAVTFMATTAPAQWSNPPTGPSTDIPVLQQTGWQLFVSTTQVQLAWILANHLPTNSLGSQFALVDGKWTVTGGVVAAEYDLIALAALANHETNAAAHAGLFDIYGSSSAVSNWAAGAFCTLAQASNIAANATAGLISSATATSIAQSVVSADPRVINSTTNASGLLTWASGVVSLTYASLTNAIATTFQPVGAYLTEVLTSPTNLPAGTLVWTAGRLWGGTNQTAGSGIGYVDATNAAVAVVGAHTNTAPLLAHPGLGTAALSSNEAFAASGTESKWQAYGDPDYIEPKNGKGIAAGLCTFVTNGTIWGAHLYLGVAAITNSNPDDPINGTNFVIGNGAALTGFTPAQIAAAGGIVSNSALIVNVQNATTMIATNIGGTNWFGSTRGGTNYLWPMIAP